MVVILNAHVARLAVTGPVVLYKSAGHAVVAWSVGLVLVSGCHTRVRYAYRNEVPKKAEVQEEPDQSLP